LFVTVCLLAASVADAQTFRDGDFDLEQNWSLSDPFLFPDDLVGGNVDALQLSGDGNPDNYLRFEIEGVPVPLGTATQAWGILINAAAAYDPSFSGPIQTVDFDFDGRRPPGGRGSRVVALAVQQDGFLWAALAERVFLGDDEQAWTGKRITGLDASDFTPHIWGTDGQPANPDFSGGGSPLAFGVTTGTSCPATTDCSGPPTPVAADIDNFLVTVRAPGVSDDITDLAVEKMVDDTSIRIGEFASYTVTVSNGGPGDAAEVLVSDTLEPSEGLLVTPIEFSVSQGSFDYDPDTMTFAWNMGGLANGDSATLSYQVLSLLGSPPGVLTNTAEVMLGPMSNTEDQNPDNDVDRVDVIVGGADLELTIAGPAELEYVQEELVGGNVIAVTAEPTSWRLTVENQGPGESAARLRLAATWYRLCGTAADCSGGTDALFEGPEDCDREAFPSEQEREELGVADRGSVNIWTCDVSSLAEGESATFAIVMQSGQELFSLFEPEPMVGLIDEQTTVDPQPDNDRAERSYSWVLQSDSNGEGSSEGGCESCALSGSGDKSGLGLLLIMSWVGLRLLRRQPHRREG
jgi:uncharacterized repeat protein (TIGR01451 family)